MRKMYIFLASYTQRNCNMQNASSESQTKPSKCTLRSPAHLIRNNQQNEFGGDNDFDDTSPMATNRETLSGIVYLFLLQLLLTIHYYQMMTSAQDKHSVMN